MALRQDMHELLIFGWKLFVSCKFAIAFFTFLITSHIFTFGLARYDFLFLSMLLVQAVFIKCKIESWNELKVITCFHIIGLLFELFKTHPNIASWSYPESAFFKISTVPLYSGFMYAAVASFVLQSWKMLDIELKNFPPRWLNVFLAIAIYAHFFLKYVWIDIRLPLIVTVFLLYTKTWVHFTTTRRRKLPLSLGFLLVGFCLWIAENLSTFLGAWKYPHQTEQWSFVHNTKIGAWFLLYVVSFIIVWQLLLFKKRKHSARMELHTG